MIINLAKYYGVTTDYLFALESSPVNGGVNNGIVGNQQISSSVITTTNGEKRSRELTEMELELLRVCNVLDIKKN